MHLENVSFAVGLANSNTISVFTQILQINK